MGVCEASVSNWCWSRIIPAPTFPRNFHGLRGDSCEPAWSAASLLAAGHWWSPPPSLRRSTRSSGKRRKSRLREVRDRLAGPRARIPAHLSEAGTALHRAALLTKDSYIIRDNYQLDPRLPADNWQCQPLGRVLGSPASLLVRDSLLMFLPRSFVFVSACGHPGPTRLG